MSEIELSFREFYIYVVIGGAVLGALFGLVPLILGRRRKKPRMGWYGLAASTIAGAFAPLIAIVVAAVFAWLIIRDSGSADQSSSDKASEGGESAD